MSTTKSRDYQRLERAATALEKVCGITNESVTFNEQSLRLSIRVEYIERLLETLAEHGVDIKPTTRRRARKSA